MEYFKFKLRICILSVFLLTVTFFLFSFEELMENTDSISLENIYDDEKEESIIPLVPFERIPDSSSIRKTIAKAKLLSPPEEAASTDTITETDSKGNCFKIKTVYLKEKNMIAIVISPVHTEFTSFQKVPQGTWILYRNYTTGKPECIKIYPRENPELYLSLYPAADDEKRSFINICLFNAYVKKDIPISIPFDSLYYLSLTELRNITKEMLPWNIFDPPVSYSSVEAASDIIRERLNTLVYLDDSAFDEFENPVHIKNETPQTQSEILSAIRTDQRLKDIKGGINCSGFAKWVVDGIIRPVAGQGIFIKSLKSKTDVPDTYFTKPYEDRDIHFGLDWIRNLAAAALSLNVNRTVRALNSGIDVNIEPFALVPPIKLSGTTSSYSFKGYEKNAGYQTNYLEAILYYLAVTEPGHFYLGAVSRDQGSPALRQYHHIAAFFPYFDLLGNFHIDVYESGEETSIRSFMKTNNDAFTALVRIRAPETGVFNP